MPRYFFEISLGGRIIRDDVGVVFPDPERAKVAALQALTEIAAHSAPTWRRHDLWIEVSGDARQPILRVDMTLEVEQLKN